MSIRGFARILVRFEGKRRANHKNQAVNLGKKEGPSVQRKKSFLVVCISILTISAGAQVKGVLVEKILPVGYFTASVLGFARVVAHREPAALPPFHPGLAALVRTPGAVSADFYSNHLGFFCKKELEIQNVTHLPVFFRLGSLEYVNKLEGK